jgi:hypothetical protein
LEKFDNFVVYKTDDGLVNIDVYFFDDTIWLNQKLMAELFGTTKQNVSLHLSNIFKDCELSEKSVVKEFLTTADDGKNYKTNFYNLKAVVAVGFRINSEKAIKFRIWSENVLEEFIVKGFVLDDERLKQSKHFGKDYYDNLLERIREIRISERRFYQKITDLKELERLVSAYLDLAENLATRQIITNMNDWSELLTQVLRISSYPILIWKGDSA